MMTYLRMRDSRASYRDPLMEAQIVVQGRGEVTAVPDRAEIRAVVDVTAVERQDAYDDAARVSAAIDGVLAAHTAAIARSTTTAMVVRPTTRWDDGEAVRTGWQAIRTTGIEVSDFDELTAVVGELVATGAGVSGPDWHLDPANAAHNEARRLAAEDARRRADDYAAALGLTIRAVAWVAEPGLRKVEGGGAVHARVEAPLRRHRHGGRRRRGEPGRDRGRGGRRRRLRHRALSACRPSPPPGPASCSPCCGST